MRCIQPGESESGEGVNDGKSISVIAGDMYFPRNPGNDASSDYRSPDFQNAAFSAAMREVKAIRRKAKNVLGNIVLMFDQKGPWDAYFAPTSRKALRRTQYLGSLIPPHRAPLQHIIERLDLPANLSTQIEAIPEEKLKFLFLRLAIERNCSIEELLSTSMVIPRGLTNIENTELMPDLSDSEDDSDNENGLSVTGVSCGIQPGDAPFESKNLDYSDLLARCRAVAAALTVRAATTPDLDRVDTVKAFYQFDPLDSKRVDSQVVLDGAQFAQTRLGVTSDVMTNFFIKHPKGVLVKRFLTRNGVSIVLR